MAVRRLRTGTLAGTLAGPVLLVALTGCGGDDSVADPPVSSATSSPTQSPQRESPEHFIRRFADVERAMENSGNVAKYLTMTEACRPCTELAKQIRGFYRAGGYVHWAGWKIKTVEPYEAGKRPNSFAVAVVSAPTTYRESASGPIKHLDGGPATEIVTIKRVAGAWTVTGRARLST